MTHKDLMALADAYAERYNQSYESQCAQEDAGYKVPTIGEARAALSDALKQVVQDAERYRWWAEIVASGELEPLEKAFESFDHVNVTTKSAIDAAIDAAMKEKT